MYFMKTIILTAALFGLAMQTGCGGGSKEAIPPENFVANPGIPVQILNDEETNDSDSQK